MNSILDFINNASMMSFLVASIVLILAPGPDIIFLLTQSVRHGKGAGLATALGLSLGNLIHTLLVASGLALLLQSSAQVFNIVRVTGAFYLLWLAANTLRQVDTEDQQRTTQVHCFRRGLLMNILNPKVALFFIAFLPQFVITGSLPAALQLIVLGLIFTMMVMSIFISISLLAERAQPLCSLEMRSSMLFRGLIASVYALIALQLFI